MTAGLPGTGLGGIFYILLVAMMPAREAYLTVRGRSSVARWKTVGYHLAMVGGILAALAGFVWAMTSAFNLLHRIGIISPALYQSAVNASAVTSKLAAIVSISVLASLLVGGVLLRVIVGAMTRNATRPRAARGAPLALGTLVAVNGTRPTLTNGSAPEAWGE
jgi:hypothetical protein